MRQCEIDGKDFKTDGSYRVHKHRFHHEQKQAVLAELQPSQSETKQPEDDFLQIESSPEPEIEKEEQERSGGGSSGGAALAGVALLVAVGVAWWLKNKRD